MFRKARWSGAAFVGVLILASASALAPVGAQAASSRTTLTMTMGDQPQSLDPAASQDQFSNAALAGAYETLVRFSPGSPGGVTPLLATSWRQESGGKVWIFKIRQGVRFQDGSQMTASSVAYSFQRMLELNMGPAAGFTEIAAVKALGQNQVEFTLKAPFGPFLLSLASISGAAIVSPQAVRAHLKDGTLATHWLSTHMDGTGPYVMSQWEHGQQFVLTANPHYWGGWKGNHVKTIVVREVTQPATQEMMLEGGSADILGDIVDPRVPLNQLRTLAKQPGVTVKQVYGGSELIIGMNCLHGPTASVKVRQAISDAIDYKGIINGIYFGYARLAHGGVAYGDFGYNPSLPQYTYNMAKAKKLLAAAGYPKGGFSLTFTVEPNDNYLKIAALVKQSLAQLGITVNIREMPWSTEYELLENKDRAPNLFITGWYGSYPDADNELYPLYATASWGANGFNVEYYSNRRVDQLLQAARANTSSQQRLTLYNEAQKILINQAPVIWVLNQSNILAYRANVHGTLYDASNMVPDYYTLWKN